jgi:hypothetical protein
MGMAYGLLYAWLNISYTIFPPILGIVEVKGGFGSAFFILFMIGIWGFVMTLYMYYVDHNENNGLL